MAHRLLAVFSCGFGLLIASCALAQPATTNATSQTRQSIRPVQPAPPPTSPVADLTYDDAFFPGSNYDPGIPTARSILGFRVGDRAATHAEIIRTLTTWADASDRAQLFQYATTHEGRALYYLVISSSKNMRNLSAIQSDWAKLADPRTLKPGQGDRLVESLPAVAWLAYSIHGDETSGADASLAVAYQLIASTDDATQSMLDHLVVIIDPMMNPDGCDRFLHMVAQSRGANPNIDDQSLLHTGSWPAGRGNHYMFDMNRDWIYGVQPETRGRLQVVGQWSPLIFVDAHEMGAQDTYLFAPPRDPINPYIPVVRRAWWEEFAKDQAAAFDQHGWRYYTGEWSEDWYPGYSDAWATYRGAVGILYEQAGVADAGVKRPEGRILTYRESVQHHAVSSIANLTTLDAHRDALKRDFFAERRKNLTGAVEGANRVYAIPPTRNASRFNRLVDLLALQGVEMYVSPQGFVASSLTDRLGRHIDRRALPAGTILIPVTQPEAPLVRALLEFDPHMTPEFLTDERRELLRFGRSKLYDVTAWNLTMILDVGAYMLDATLPDGATPYTPPVDTSGSIVGAPAPVGYVIDGHDDHSVAAAARLLERGVEVRVADRPFAFDTIPYPRGSIVVGAADNKLFQGDLVQTIATVCDELGVQAVGAKSGLGPGDLADFGGGRFILLDRPRIAILARGSTSPTGVGSMWFTVDHTLGVRSTLLDIDSVRFTDLRRYNVLIVPETFGPGLDDRALAQIKTWVQAGGTLIASGDSAGRIAKESSKLSVVRQLPDTLGELDEYRTALARHWLGLTTQIDADAVWSNTPAGTIDFPLADADPPTTDEDELKKRDQWESIFMPQGAIVAGRIDDKNWLTFGADSYVPVVFGDDPILMVKDDANAAVRLGAFVPATAKKEKQNTDGPAWIGWAPAPKGHEMRLRMSGLLWPEAADRIANAAYLTNERVGRGQVILFASSPTFRGTALGTTRLFTNAVVFGPGFTSTKVIEP